MHVLRNSLIPVVTFLGIDIGALMGGAIVTERIFNIPGVGGYQLYQRDPLQDGATVVGIVTVLVIVYLVANLLVDLLYGRARPEDPLCDSKPPTAERPPPRRDPPGERRRPVSQDDRRVAQSVLRRLARPAPQPALLGLGRR